MRRTAPIISLAASLVAGAVVVFSCTDPLQPPTLAPPHGPSAAAAPTGTALQGSWTTPTTWPIVAAHLAVLPDGRVMTWVSSDQPGDVERHEVHVWDPATGAFTDLTAGVHNAFCAAEVFLADGRLLVAGGHIADNKGLKQAATFDWRMNAWQSTASMRAGRWYPTATMLVSGEVTIVAGSDENAAGNNYPEVWNGTSWRELPGAPLAMPYYPWMHSAPDGRVFNSGPDQVTRFLNPSAGGAWTLGPRSNGGYREYGGSVMYAPGKILIMGGGDPPTNSAETIDLNTAGGWQPTGSMAFARRQMNSTVLPNGQVLALGGTSGTGFNDESRAVLPAEVWNPATGAWTTLASIQVPRLYHSSAVLLPDARVLFAGGGRCGACTVDHFDAQIFSPPYLFSDDATPAVRPQILAAPAQVGYGQAFTVQTSSALGIARVTWVRLPATTHSFNQNQWFNELSFTAAAGALTVTAPATAYQAPPGHYMLFVLDAAGVPSVAQIVQIVGSAPLPSPPGVPAAPTALGTGPIDSQRIRLLWTDRSTGEISFRIERCTGSGCVNFVEVAQTAADVTYFRDSALAAATTYSYRVRAENAAGFSGYSNTSVATTLATGSAPPPGPIVHRATGLCLDVRNGARADDGDHVLLAACSGGSSQQWTIPAGGALGDVLVFGTKCLDAWTGQGNDGDPINIYACHGGTNQQWGISTTGELRGGFGKCVVPATSPVAAGTEFVLGACTGATAQKWAVNPGTDLPPIADFTSSCSGLSCTLNSSASSDDRGIASRAWSFGDGDSAGDVVTPLKVYATPGLYSVTLTVTDAAGQTDTKTRTVSAVSLSNTPPVAAFNSGCTGLACTFTDVSTDANGTIASRSWAFGDGATSILANPAHTYAAAGSYTVTLTVVDDGSASSVVSNTVTVVALPPATAVPIVTRTGGKCLGVQGGVQTNATPIVLGACANRPEQRWTMPPPGIAGAVTVYTLATCLDASGGQGNDGDPIIIWPCHNGPGKPGPNETWTYTAAGELKGINGKCIAYGTNPVTTGAGLVLAPCTGVAGQKFDVGSVPANSPPTAAFTAACTNLVCTFTDGSSDADGAVTAWAWSFGDGSTSTARSPARSYAAAGSYTVNLTVTDDRGATASTSRTVTVSGPVVNQPPLASFTVSCTLLACTFTDASTDIDGTVAGWSWAFGDGATSTARNPAYSYAAAGAYTVTLTATDDKGAPGSTSRSLTLKTTRSIASQGAAGKCMEVENGGQLNGTRIFIVPCSGATKQRWTAPAAGIAGDYRMFGTMCLDAASGLGNDGDKILLWECHGGPNQQWTLTAAGELRGGSGKCITLNGGAIADFTEMAIFPCTGLVTQKWALGPP